MVYIIRKNYNISKKHYSKFLRAVRKYFLFVAINMLMHFPTCTVFSSLFRVHFIAKFFFSCRGGLNPSRLTMYIHIIYKKHERVFIPGDVYHRCLGQTFSWHWEIFPSCTATTIVCHWRADFCSLLGFLGRLYHSK